MNFDLEHPPRWLRNVDGMLPAKPLRADEISGSCFGVPFRTCSADVMRFLGHKPAATGRVHGNFAGEVLVDLPDGRGQDEDLVQPQTPPPSRRRGLGVSR